MQKLYPQVLRAEQSIQELRGELQEAEAEGRSQRGQLSEADRQIRDLYARLGDAERSHQDLSHEHNIVTLQTEENRERCSEGERECKELAEALLRSEEDISAGLQMLAHRTCLQEQEREQIGLAAQDVAERRMQLVRVDALTQDLRASLAQCLREGRGFEEELVCAGHLDESRQETLDKALAEQSQQHRRNDDAHHTLRELRLRVALLEQDSQETGAKLTNMEAGDCENQRLESELEEMTREMYSLEARLQAADAGSEEALESTILSEKISEEIQQQIVAAEETVQEDRYKMDTLEDWWRVAEVKLTYMRRDHALLNQNLQKAERDGVDAEKKVEERLHDLTHRDGSLRDRVTELETEMTNAVKREVEAREQCSRLEERIVANKSESSLLRSRKSEAEQAVQEIRNKPACSVS